MYNRKRLTGTMLIVLFILGQVAAFLPGIMPNAVADTSRTAETGYWIELTPMNDARYDHTMHLLQNDSLLVIGGTNGTSALSSVEIYNPLIGVWGHATPMATERTNHVSIDLQNNTILVIGGYDGTGTALASVELYDPAASSWYSLPDMPFAGGDMTAAILQNGSVLVAGGNDRSTGNPRTNPQAVVFDVSNGTWSNIAFPSFGTMGGKLYRLLNQTYLFVGGSTGTPWYDGILTADLYNPISETWTQLPDMAMGRHRFDGCTLGSGHVALLGGIRRMGPGFDILNTTVNFNTTSGSWVSGPEMVYERYGHTATLLPEGEVLMVGGRNATSVHNSTEVLQTRNGISVEGPVMKENRMGHAAVRNSQGNVVISGGLGASVAMTSVEMFVPGLKEEDLAVEVFAVDYVASEGQLEISGHTYNDTTGHISGVLVTFETEGIGSFDSEWGLSDEEGIVTTTYNAPRNTGTMVMDLDITITTHKRGYKDIVEVFPIHVFPETQGESVPMNDSLYHLVYVTVYSDGAPFLNDSMTHSGMDLVGDELVMLDGVPTVVANFSTWEKVDKTFMSSGLMQHFVSESTGFHYYDYNLEGIVHAHTTKTTFGHVWDDDYENWYNTSEVREITYLPAKRWFNSSVPVMGAHKEVVNTYIIDVTTKNLNTGAVNRISKLETEYKNFVLTAWEEVDTVIGHLDTDVFLDETGLVYDYYDDASGILIQTIEFNDTGKLASTRTLLELNDVIGEDPTSPLLQADVTVDDPTIVASMTTPVGVTVTADGAPVEGMNVDLQVTEGGWVDIDVGVTDQNGHLNVTFTAESGIPTTTVNITALVNGQGHRSNFGKASVMVVEDSAAPTIVHRPVYTADEGELIPIFALAMDDILLTDVLLHFRIGSSDEFMTMVMEEVLGAFTADIPKGAVSAPLVQYYITAEDINGNKAISPTDGPEDPYNITVTPKVRLLPVVSSVLMGGGGIQVKAAVRGNLSIQVNRAADPGTDDGRHLGLFARVATVGDGELIWANITFTYREPMLGDLDEDELRVYRWDETTSSWIVVSATDVLVFENKVWANVTDLSTFAPRVLNVPTPPVEPDITGPSVIITSPSDDARLDSGIIIIGGIASDDVGLQGVEVRLDDGEWFSVWVPEGARTSGWNLELAVGTGPHTIKVRAIDTTGNVGEIAEVEVMVFKENPTDGVDQRFALMTLVSIVIVLIITLFLIGGKSKTAEPDEEEQHLGPHDDEDIDDDEEGTGAWTEDEEEVFPDDEE